MTPGPSFSDALRPSAAQTLAAWAERVRADREQVERCREVEDPADFYAPVAQRFSQDPRRTDDAVLDELLALAQPEDDWLDIGSGGGRYTLPLALHVRGVTALDPSPAMLDVLRAGMAGHGIGGIDILEGRWPLVGEPVPTADVTLMAHVGYDIEDVGPFLAAAERASRRLCVAVMGEGATTTTAALLWKTIHGEARVPLPALPELVTLLMAQGRLPSLTLAQRMPPAFETADDLLTMARRQLWVRPGSDKDRRLAEQVAGHATERDGGWAMDWRPTRVGIVSWEPVALEDQGLESSSSMGAPGARA
jgi:SAM-dependent methyltransferase